MSDPSHIMWTIRQIAERDNVSKMAVSKAARKMLEDRHDTPVERDSHGRVMKISLAHYDEYRHRHINPAKATAPIRSTSSPGSASMAADPNESFEEARRQAEWLKVGRERIRHQEDIGQLVRKDLVDAAIKSIAIEIQKIVSRLQNSADDVALAISREGVHGARTALRNAAFDLGNQIADKLADIADSAPEHDDLIEADDL